VPFALITKSTFVAAFVAVSDTAGTVTFGAEVLTSSVKWVRPPPAVANVPSPR